MQAATRESTIPNAAKPRPYIISASDSEYPAADTESELIWNCSYSEHKVGWCEFQDDKAKPTAVSCSVYGTMVGGKMIVAYYEKLRNGRCH